MYFTFSRRNDAVRDEMCQPRFAREHDVWRILSAGQKNEKRLGQRVTRNFY